VPFVATDEETSGPLAMVGDDKVALIEGTGNARRLAMASIVDGRVVRRIEGVDGATVRALATTPRGDTLFYVASRTVSSLSLKANGNGTPRMIRAGDGVSVDPSGAYLVILLLEPSGVRLVRRSIADGGEQPIRLPPDLRLAPITSWGTNAIGPGGRLALRLAPSNSWFWPAAIVEPVSGRAQMIPGGDRADMMYTTWTRDGRVVTLALLMRAALWRLTPQPAD